MIKSLHFAPLTPVVEKKINVKHLKSLAVLNKNEIDVKEDKSLDQRQDVKFLMLSRPSMILQKDLCYLLKSNKVCPITITEEDINT